MLSAVPVSRFSKRLFASHRSQHFSNFFSLVSTKLDCQYRSFSKEMKDEYGNMTSEGETFVKKEFMLENGVILPEAQLRYQTLI